MAKYLKGIMKYLKDTFKYLKGICHMPKYLKGLNPAVSMAWPHPHSSLLLRRLPQDPDSEVTLIQGPTPWLSESSPSGIRAWFRFSADRELGGRAGFFIQDNLELPPQLTFLTGFLGIVSTSPNLYHLS